MIQSDLHSQITCFCIYISTTPTDLSLSTCMMSPKQAQQMVQNFAFWNTAAICVHNSEGTVSKLKVYPLTYYSEMLKRRKDHQFTVQTKVHKNVKYNFDFWLFRCFIIQGHVLMENYTHNISSFFLSRIGGSSDKLKTRFAALHLKNTNQWVLMQLHYQNTPFYVHTVWQ